jgi:hypothetical protein
LGVETGPLEAEALSLSGKHADIKEGFMSKFDAGSSVNARI